MPAESRCRFCDAPLECTFVDLGVTPLANSYVSRENRGAREMFFPLHAYVCSQCLLVQLEEFATPGDIFSHYAYFSSYSDTWQRHCAAYAGEMVERCGLSTASKVVELASNDGCLLRCFVEKGIPVLGIEPAANVAAVAESAGVPTVAEFFGVDLARRLRSEGHHADLLAANNVLAHVPDLHDFVEGMRMILAPEGVITIEFPHLLQLIGQCQFDTIYHEHFSYFSLKTTKQVLGAHGLTVFDVAELPTHGGSLRIFARHDSRSEPSVCSRVAELDGCEAAAGLHDLATYAGFDLKVKALKCDLLDVLISIKRAGKSVAAYGAPAKGNTLLNYCGIGTDLIDFTVDRNPAKQGHFLPGSRIPVHAPDRISETKPDYVLILPWNIRDEIMEQNHFIRAWGGQFIVPIPQPEILA